MATRSRTSFQKRQKEIARMEKQREKAARKAQRKMAPPEPDFDENAVGPGDPEALAEEQETEDVGEHISRDDPR